MAITNISKPSSSIANQTKINIGESWDSNTSSWDTETRSWNEMASLLENVARVGAEYLATEALDFLMTEDNDYLMTGVGLITNQAKPS
jgi:hypothetical protein